MNTHYSTNSAQQFKVKCVFASRPELRSIRTLTAHSTMDAIEQFIKKHTDQDIRSITAKAV